MEANTGAVGSGVSVGRAVGLKTGRLVLVGRASDVCVAAMATVWAMRRAGSPGAVGVGVVGLIMLPMTRIVIHPRHKIMNVPATIGHLFDFIANVPYTDGG